MIDFLVSQGDPMAYQLLEEWYLQGFFTEEVFLDTQKEIKKRLRPTLPDPCPTCDLIGGYCGNC